MNLEDLIPLIYYTRTRVKRLLVGFPATHNTVLEGVAKELLSLAKCSKVLEKELPLNRYLLEITHNYLVLEEAGCLNPDTSLVDEIKGFVREKLRVLAAVYSDQNNQSDNEDNNRFLQFRLQHLNEEDFLSEQDCFSGEDNDRDKEAEGENDDEELCFSSLNGAAINNKDKAATAGENYYSFNLDDLPGYEPLEEILKLLRPNTVTVTGTVVGQASQGFQVSRVLVALKRLLAYDVSDLFDNSQWSELIDLFNRTVFPGLTAAFLLHSSKEEKEEAEEALITAYAVWFRWMRGFGEHFQSTDLLTSLLLHLQHFLPTNSHNSDNTNSNTNATNTNTNNITHTNSSDVMVDFSEDGGSLSRVTRSQLSLLLESLDLIASLPQFTLSPSEAHYILCLLLSLLSHHRIIIINNNSNNNSSKEESWSLLAVLLSRSLSRSNDAMRRILRETCQQPFNLLIAIAQTGFLTHLLSMNHTSSKAGLLLEIANHFLSSSSDHFIALLHLFRDLSTSTPSQSLSSRSSQSSSDFSAAGSMNNLFVQQKNHRLDFNTIFSTLFTNNNYSSDSSSDSLRREEEALGWWIDHMIINNINNDNDGSNDSGESLMVFVHLAKIISFHCSSSSSSFPVSAVKKRCSEAMERLCLIAFSHHNNNNHSNSHHSNPKDSDSDNDNDSCYLRRVSCWIKELSVLHSDRLLPPSLCLFLLPLISQHLLPLLSHRLNHELAANKGLVLSEVISAENPFQYLTLAIHTQSLLYHLRNNTNNNTLSMTDATRTQQIQQEQVFSESLLVSIFYHLSIFLPHRTSLFHCNSSSASSTSKHCNECQKVFLLLLAACKRHYNSHSSLMTVTETASENNNIKKGLHGKLFLILLRFFFFLSESDSDKLLLLELAQTLLILRRFLATTAKATIEEEAKEEVKRLYARCVEKMFTHSNCAELALTAAHSHSHSNGSESNDCDFIVMNQNPIHLPFLFFLRITDEHSDFSPIRAMIAYLTDSYPSSSEEKKRGIEVGEAFLTAHMTVPGFPLLLKLLLVYLDSCQKKNNNNNENDKTATLNEKEIRQFAADNADIFLN